MRDLANSDELSMFTTTSLQQMSKFKWEKSAFNHHLWWMMNHFVYLGVLIFYVIYVYIDNNLKKANEDPHDNPFALLLIVVNIIPALYEAIYVIKYGIRNYFNLQNSLTFVYLYGSMLTGYIHF